MAFTAAGLDPVTGAVGAVCGVVEEEEAEAEAGGGGGGESGSGCRNGGSGG